MFLINLYIGALPIEGMEFCLVCKEIVNDRYTIKVDDTSHLTSVDGHVCRRCWDRFVASYHNEGPFKASQFFAWIKEKKEMWRH